MLSPLKSIPNNPVVLPQAVSVNQVLDMYHRANNYRTKLNNTHSRKLAELKAITARYAPHYTMNGEDDDENNEHEKFLKYF